MRFVSKTAFVLVSATLLCSVAQASPAATGAEPIAACMAHAAADLGFNGVVYARHGDLTIEKEFGAADTGGKTPVTGETRFNIGSAAKMFTAVAIGRLVDKGTVQLDAPIGRYLTDLKPEFARITVAELLNHTSGLGDYFNPQNKAAIDAAVTATDLLPLALATPPAFTPGSKRAYSNSGFVVLGAIIEKVSGLSYADFIRKEILAPLGMTHTRMEVEGSADPMSRMSPEGMLDKPRPSPFRQLRASPAGGIFSTASDLSVFLTVLTDGRLLSHATSTALLMPRTDPGGGPGTYGYGFNVRVKPTLRVGHGGGAPGVNAEIALYPESGWQLIALSNYDPPVASRMVTVLESVVAAADPAAACTMALADPALKAPMAPPQH
jgi:CubicO group peptidase (beta-lactamase class C family)